jgi:hypothetical protein
MRRRLYDSKVLGTEVLIPTTITLPLWAKNKMVTQFWSYQEVFLLGLKAKEENPQLIQRIRELEQGNEKLQKHLGKLAQKIIMLGGNLND